MSATLKKATIGTALIVVLHHWQFWQLRNALLLLQSNLNPNQTRNFNMNHVLILILISPTPLGIVWNAAKSPITNTTNGKSCKKKKSHALNLNLNQKRALISALATTPTATAMTNSRNPNLNLISTTPTATDTLLDFKTPTPVMTNSTTLGSPILTRRRTNNTPQLRPIHAT